MNSKIAVVMRFFFADFFKTRLTVSCVEKRVQRYLLLCLPECNFIHDTVLWGSEKKSSFV